MLKLSLIAINLNFYLPNYAQIQDRNRSNDKDIKANQVKFNFKQKWIEADQNTLTFNQFRVAARSKKETYDILTIKEENIYYL